MRLVARVQCLLSLHSLPPANLLALPLSLDTLHTCWRFVSAPSDLLFLYLFCTQSPDAQFVRSYGLRRRIWPAAQFVFRLLPRFALFRSASNLTLSVVYHVLLLPRSCAAVQRGLDRQAAHAAVPSGHLPVSFVCIPFRSVSDIGLELLATNVLLTQSLLLIL
jgi:hypothetical protein